MASLASSSPDVTFRLGFIGSGSIRRGFSSRLGRDEVIGDLFALCAQDATKGKITSESSSFISCLFTGSKYVLKYSSVYNPRLFELD